MTNPTSMAEAFRIFWSNASPPRRRMFYATLGCMLLGAFAELATIGAVLPFLALVSDPARAQDYSWMSWAAALFGGGERGVILAAAALLIAIAIVAGLIRILLVWISMRFVLLFGHDLAKEIFARLLRQPYGDYVTRNSSIAISGVQKLNSVVFSVIKPLMQGLSAAVISIFIVLGLFLLDPVAAGIAGSTLGLTYLVVSLSTRRRLDRNSRMLDWTATQRVKVVQESLGGLRDILIDNSQSVYEETFARLDYGNRLAVVVTTLISLMPRYIVEMSVMIVIAVITVYFTQQPGGLVAAIPVLGALAVGAQRLLPLIHQTYTGWAAFSGNGQVIKEVAGLLTLPMLRSAGTRWRAERQSFEHEIAFENVTFRYQGGKPALEKVNLTITKGERIGFVGKTGSGKSTLIDLLMGLLPANEGTIRIDGVPLDPQTIARWQAQIAHVPQAIYLADGTIASNIAFGIADEDIDLDRVRQAARRADIAGFIESLPDGYASTVGERGVRLSGGQRQRVGIARALYKGASVLVFDEATSALDEETEAQIMRSIYELDADVTLLMIAHRLSTLKGCDRIVRLAHGSVVEIVDQYSEAAPAPA